MIALITGGAGFLGHHLVNHILYHTDWEVIVLDKLSYAARGFDRLREANILTNERVKVLTHDLEHPFSAGLKSEIGRPDFIFHLAAESHVDNSIKDPLEFVRSNVLGTVQLLEWARGLYGCKRSVYMSTDEVFGEASPGLSFDAYSRHLPRNPYAASKSAGEQMVVSYDVSYERIEAQIVHCMNIFGERQHPEKFIPKVIKRMLNEEEIEIYTDEEGVVGSRMYIHADDVARALVALVQLPKTAIKHNIRGVKEINNDVMVNIIGNVLDRGFRAERVAFDLGDSCHDLRYDIEGDLPVHTTEEELDEQLKETIVWTASHQQWLEE